MTRARVASLMWLLLGGGAPALAEVVSVEASGPAVPCARVEHVIERSQGTWVARISKALVEGFGRTEGVGLLTDESWLALVAQLDALGAFSLTTENLAKARIRYRVRLEVGDRHHTFEVGDPGRLPDGRHLAVIELVQRAVQARAGPVPLRDEMLLPTEAGLLQIGTDLAARVRVDGAWLAEQTPVRGLRLPAGEHVVELVPVDGSEPHRYEIKVDVGRTTSLRVELR